ncbi:hypothetical protein BC940DRAFT_181052 [Gongronella butleri]|nr:hypothetical protein BC940DRAFT_181052 [Gongronella butleri]
MLRYLKSKIPASFPSERHVDDTEESEHLLETTQDAVVVDRNHIVYWVFFLYGIAMLLPWNVFITASEFFMHRFAGSEYQETFQSYFSTYFTTTNLIMFVYLIWRQSVRHDLLILGAIGACAGQ